MVGCDLVPLLIYSRLAMVGLGLFWSRNPNFKCWIFWCWKTKTGCGLPLKIKVGKHTDFFSTSIRYEKKQAWTVAGFRSSLEESWGRMSSIILVSVTNSKYLVVVIGGEGLKSSQGKCRSCITIRHKYLNKNKATSHSSDVKTLWTWAECTLTLFFKSDRSN